MAQERRKKRRSKRAAKEGPAPELSRRERQVMDIVYSLGAASCTEIHDRLPDKISNPAVRSVLRILEQKGHLEHHREGSRFVYTPTVPRNRARVDALRHLVQTFFEGSPEGAMAALLEMQTSDLPLDDLQRMEELIECMRAQRGGEG
jgi:predicted transcriptional regulator